MEDETDILLGMPIDADPGAELAAGLLGQTPAVMTGKRPAADDIGGDNKRRKLVESTGELLVPAGPSRAVSPNREAVGANALPRLPYGAVVKLFVQRVGQSYSMPWRSQPQQAATASGFLIDVESELEAIQHVGRHEKTAWKEGDLQVSQKQLEKLYKAAGGAFHLNRMILTNAHVVHRQTSVLVQRHGSPGKFPGRVLCVGRGCDLALLTVDSPAFWAVDESVTPLKLSSKVPLLDENVTCVGYPMGGHNVCVTRGIVSRVDMHCYAVGQNPLLTIQIDAALNPGNSGGPCFDSSHRVVGVAYGTLKKASSAGYIIPVEVVRLFLGQYVTLTSFPGVSDIGVTCQNLENPSLRTYLKLDDDMATGVRVRKVATLGPAKDLLMEDDVILAVNNQAVAQDGTVEFRTGERIDASYLISSTAMYMDVEVQVSRQGKEKRLKIRCEPPVFLVPRLDGVDASPSYFIFGGLVFVPLSLPWMTEIFKKKQPSHIRRYLHESPSAPGEQVIVLSHVLAHNINMGYHSLSNIIVKTVNGVEVSNLAEMAMRIQEVARSGKDGQKNIIDFLFLYGTKVALEVGLCLEKRQEILSLHAIHSAASPDLRHTLTL